ncbi:trypsin-like peptidase domain-containing protein [Winogradskyella maritima]|uniref:Trypsin-like peptidase domain-containing protein n=1 Tax=Winogradskyella maritima TaxID=1517766 RepID=A0ABV8AFM8_9FLAO|nr:trypsin-like peptidase domain-containing protein [Winogradskyella maritima]
MRKMLTLMFVSALGGLLTLGGYKLFIEEPTTANTELSNTTDNSFFIPTSTVSNSALAMEKPDFIEAANKTIDAVVHVKNAQVSKGPSSFEDLIYGRSQERKQIVGAGSGVIISSDGHIITNNHVIKGATELSITLNDNKTYTADVVGTDPRTDIALLKIDADYDLPFVTFGDSDNAQIGEWVLAVGNPFNLTSTVTAGIISAKSRDLSGRAEQSFIQTDAAVNPGNSGGALVNTQGQLIGINTAISSRTGSYVGYSFAVPSNIARKIVEDIMEFGDVQDVMLGIVSLNAAEAKKQGLDQIEGVYVSDVSPDSGAAVAGIRSGDIIKGLDNIEVNKFTELTGYLKSKSPDEVVNVTILRDDDLRVVPVRLTKKEDLTETFMDMTLRDIAPSVKKKYDINNGVLIQENNNSWLRNKVGIGRGYIITGINDVKIESVEDIRALKAKYGDDFIDNLNKIEYLNGRLERKEVIFR